MKSRTTSPKLAGVAILLFASVFLFFASRELYRDFQFEKTTGRSTATIDRSISGNKGGHSAHYHYLVEGALMNGSSGISPATYHQVNVGQVVPIKYLIDDPTLSRIDSPTEAQWHWHNDKIAFGVGSFIATIGVLVVCFAKPVQRTTLTFQEVVDRFREGWRNR